MLTGLSVSICATIGCPSLCRYSGKLRDFGALVGAPKVKTDCGWKRYSPKTCGNPRKHPAANIILPLRPPHSCRFSLPVSINDRYLQGSSVLRDWPWGRSLCGAAPAWRKVDEEKLPKSRSAGSQTVLVRDEADVGRRCFTFIPHPTTGFRGVWSGHPSDGTPIRSFARRAGESNRSGPGHPEPV